MTSRMSVTVTIATLAVPRGWGCFDCVETCTAFPFYSTYRKQKHFNHQKMITELLVDSLWTALDTNKMQASNKGCRIRIEGYLNRVFGAFEFVFRETG
jgi:hypothetical protein